MPESLGTLDYHVLLALAGEPLYGYAIAQVVEEESEGALAPRAGTLYRVLARLMTQGLVGEEDPPGGRASHPGRARRWYALTAEGRARLAEETRRLGQAVALAERRLGTEGP